MSHLFIRFSLTLAVICCFSFSHAQEKWSLEQCITFAQQNNIQLKQSELSTMLSKDSYTQSQLGLLPNLNASSSYGINTGKNIDPTSNLFVNQSIRSGNISLSTNVTLFSGFSKINEMRKAYFDFMASRYSTEQMVNDISLSVATAYLQILFAQENLTTAEATEQLSQDQVDRTKQLVDAGVLAQGSLLQIQSQKALDELNTVTAKNQLTLAKLNLQQLLNMDHTVDIVIPDLKIPVAMAFQEMTAGTIYETALTLQPGIKSAELKLKGAEKGLAAARGAYSPSLSLFGSLSSQYSNAVKKIKDGTLTFDTTQIGIDGFTFAPVYTLTPSYQFENTPLGNQIKDNFGQGFGVSLNFPIFNGWATHTNISRSKVNMLNEQYNLDLQKQQLKKSIETAFADAVAAKDRYSAALKSESSFEQSFNYTEQKFNAGLLTSFDYVTAQNSLSKARSESLQAKFEYIFKLKVLDYYQGKPLNLQ
ncbi:MAG: TolC family protein [Bacteroidota bacterium]